MPLKKKISHFTVMELDVLYYFCNIFFLNLIFLKANFKSYLTFKNKGRLHIVTSDECNVIL